MESPEETTGGRNWELQPKPSVANLSRETMDKIYMGNYDDILDMIKQVADSLKRNEKILEINTGANDAIEALHDAMESGSEQDQTTYKDRISKLEELKTKTLEFFEEK